MAYKITKLFEELIDWVPALESFRPFRGSVLQVGLCLGHPLRPPRPTRGAPGMALKWSQAAFRGMFSKTKAYVMPEMRLMLQGC